MYLWEFLWKFTFSNFISSVCVCVCLPTSLPPVALPRNNRTPYYPPNIFFISLHDSSSGYFFFLSQFFFYSFNENYLSYSFIHHVSFQIFFLFSGLRVWSRGGGVFFVRRRRGCCIVTVVTTEQLLVSSWLYLYWQDINHLIDEGYCIYLIGYLREKYMEYYAVRWINWLFIEISLLTLGSTLLLSCSSFCCYTHRRTPVSIDLLLKDISTSEKGIVVIRKRLWRADGIVCVTR